MIGSTQLLLAIICFCAAMPVAAQTLPDPAGLQLIHATRLAPDEIVTVDGVLDERFWETVHAATDFRQREPDNGAPATEQTEVRVVYDDDRVILGVTLHDSEPDRLFGNQMQRDQPFIADDRFMWTIDPFLDGRSGYFFEINPSGAMGDGLVDPAEGGGGGDGSLGGGINRSWDGIWLARVRHSQTGWTAEIEIPFRTINFDPGAAAWGINFQRTVRRKNEESLWTGYARNQGLARMSNAGQVSGFHGISQGLGLDVKPYVVGNRSAAPGRGRPDSVTTGTAGVDLFYSLTPALRANLSVNTDFAEAEVDARRINLTRFPLFLEEKRDFFLEGAAHFDFSRDPGRDITPFFSRRIGLDADGAPRRIDVGAKLTGQTGPFDLGVLQVRTASRGADTSEDFSIVRLRRRLFLQSYVGGMYTHRASAGDHRQTAGADFELRTSAFRGSDNLELSGFSLWTSNPNGTGRSSARGFVLSYPNDPLRAGFAYRNVEPNYNPAVGFVERVGLSRWNPDVGYTWRPTSHPFIRDVEARVDLAWYLSNPGNILLTTEHVYRPAALTLHDGSTLAFEVRRQYERLEDHFEISDGVILPRDAAYEFTRYRFEGETASHRVASAAAAVEFGDFFSGQRQELNIALTARPRRGVAMTVELERNVLSLPEGSFDTNLVRLLANTQFNAWISLVNNLQYDSLTRVLGWQMRFRWIQRPGNDIYLVYTHNWHEILRGTQHEFITLDRRAASKIVYTLRF
jgi:hypothetical protein